VINSNFGRISHRFRDMASFLLKTHIFPTPIQSHSVMSSLDNIWKHKRLSLPIKLRVYLALVHTVSAPIRVRNLDPHSGRQQNTTLCLKKKHVTTFFAITGTMNVRL